MIKKILLLTILIFTSIQLSSVAETNYAKLYEQAQPPNFELVFNIDPYQNEDYQKYAYAPYPLFRLSSDVHFKKQTIPAGYYILTPREMKGNEYIFFKEAGKVKYIIPVVKKELVPVDFYHNNLPTPKYTKWQKFCKGTSEKFYKLFKNSSKKAPAPKSYVITENIEGNMYLIILYYGDHKYHMVFKSYKD